MLRDTRRREAIGGGRRGRPSANGGADDRTALLPGCQCTASLSGQHPGLAHFLVALQYCPILLGSVQESSELTWRSPSTQLTNSESRALSIIHPYPVQ